MKHRYVVQIPLTRGTIQLDFFTDYVLSPNEVEQTRHDISTLYTYAVPPSQIELIYLGFGA